MRRSSSLLSSSPFLVANNSSVSPSPLSLCTLPLGFIPDGSVSFDSAYVKDGVHLNKITLRIIGWEDGAFDEDVLLSEFKAMEDSINTTNTDEEDKQLYMHNESSPWC